MHTRTSAAATGVAVGLRGPHFGEVLATRPAVGWFEVHAENFIDNSAGAQRLESVRRDYGVSLHGVGLSLGSASAPDRDHLLRLKQLIDRIQPMFVSEHLSWSTWGGHYLNDLLPRPYTAEALAIVCRNVELTQLALTRPILMENASAYLRFRHSTIAEADFLNEVAHRTGCGLLCDINNLYVNSRNVGLNAVAFIETINASAVGEIHLAGHCRIEQHGQELLIDDHGSPVAQPVWELYARALSRFGNLPTVIEWDRQLPTLAVLLREAQRAATIATTASLMREKHRACVA
jgi:uncharacterized protein (UPF0276 family)